MRRNDRLLARRQRRQRPVDLAVAGAVLGLGRRRVEIAVGRHLDAAADPPERVDQLEAGDGIEPRADRRVGAPGVPLQVNRQQGFLHDILRIETAMR